MSAIRNHQKQFRKKGEFRVTTRLEIFKLKDKISIFHIIIL